MSRNGAHVLVDALAAAGADHAFGIAGDHILPVLDALADGRRLRFVGSRHEAAAVHMADAFARARGDVCVAMYTTAGFVNALAGLAYAMYSEAPVISLSGSAPLGELGRGAMQEVDQIAAALPFTKGAWLVPSADRIPEFVARAARTALTGRRGPVHLTVPIDAQEARVSPAVAGLPPRDQYVPLGGGAPPAEVARAVDLLRGARRPLVLASGPAAYAPGAGPALQQFIETTGLPLFTEDLARGLVPDTHPLVFGYFERGLNRAARLLAEADAVLLLGRKQEYTIGYLQPPAVAASARVVQVVPDPEAVATNRAVDAALVGDVATVVRQLTEMARAYTWPALPWLERLRAARQETAAYWEERAASPHPLTAAHVHRVLSTLLTGDDVLLFDGGDFGDIGRATYPALRPGRWWCISGMGLLGAALPGALGAKLAHPERRVVAFCGDGGFGFHALELETALRERVPVLVVVGNDDTWGIDYHLQVGLYGRPMGVNLSPGIRYDVLAASLGAHGEYVARAEDLRPAAARALAALERGQAAVLNVQIARSMSPRAQMAIDRARARTQGQMPEGLV